MLRFQLGLGALVSTARGATYEVGPTRVYKNLQQVTGLLRGGDVVTVDGGVTYKGGVTFGANAGKGVITVRGLLGSGGRPVLAGTSVQGGSVIRVLGSGYLIEGFDLTGGGDARVGRGFYSVGDDVTLRDCVVHDCHCTGIAASDVAGSLTLDGVEVYHCGNGLYAHQIYVGSSLAKYPGAVFRMQYCYVHDGTGGNNVKSRVTRNEIEYNWIEGAAFHELDLVGPDPKAQKTPAGGVHCDGDIVGNVLVVAGESKGTVARLGSDGTAASRGRYSFENNTVIVDSELSAGFGLLWLKGEVDSLTVWNNVFWCTAGPMKLTRMEGAPAPAMAGDGNWLPVGTTNAPAEWRAVRGTDPGFADVAQEDYRPVAGSPLIGAGSVQVGGVPVTGVPPLRQAAADHEVVRPAGRAKDIGAYPLPGAP